MDYRSLARSFLETTHPKEKRRPPTETEQYEHAKDGTIRYLFEHDGVASPAQLIEFFGFSHARLTKLLGGLEEDGMVIRRPDSADRRRITVHLTEQGLEYATAKQEQLLRDTTAVLEYLGKEDAQHFVRIITHLLNTPWHVINPKGGCL